MFRRLALPVFLCCGSALAIRLESNDLLEPSVAEAPKLKARAVVFTQTQIRSYATLNATNPNIIRDAIRKSFLRGCLHEVALEREAFYHEQNVTWAASPELGNISMALEALFEAEDGHSGWGSGAKAEKQNVELLGLDLPEATTWCNDEAGQPIARVVRTCVIDFAAHDRTRTKDWLFRRGKGSKALAGDNTHLVGAQGLLEMRFRLDYELQLMDLSSNTFMSAAPNAEQVKAQYRGILAENKEAVKATGFSFTNTHHHCQDIHKDETLRADEKYMERVALELSRAQDESGECQESTGSHYKCPESTSPRHARSYRTTRAAAVFAVAYAFSQTVVPLALLSLGGSVATALFLAVPGANTMFSLPFAALSGIPIFGRCGCELNPCEWNADMGVCAFTPSDKSTNVFQWLPYPGTKCAPGADFTAENPKCEMRDCALEDYQLLRPGTGLYGKLGMDGQSAVNCLSDDGMRAGDLGLKEAFGDGQPNTPENRHDIYASLNATLSG